jgi:ATP-dependent Lhr-like helicase
MTEVLGRFSAVTRAWFEGAFPAPTPAQVGAWDAISTGAHALVVAPTGSGKTLASFLWSIDKLATSAPPEDLRHRTRVLYISPLKALGVDVERNLRTPLVGIGQAARRLEVAVPAITVGVRSGDTPPEERRVLARTPPDILITTPESLYLMLTSQARETLAGVETVIIDEVHAVAATKRGAHLAVSLERLDELLEKPAQRIGLSATVRPTEEVARFLGGRAPVTIVNPPASKTFDLRVVVPVEDMTELGGGTARDSEIPEGSASANPPQSSIWPHVEEEIVDLIEAHRSTIVFTNSRRLAERLTGRLNEIAVERAELAALSAGELAAAELTTAEFAADSPAVPPGGGAGGMPAAIMAQSGVVQGAPPLLARAHHGSVSKEQRAVIEDDLKSGRLRCVVATSSLELGIDMGAVDLVVQVGAPPSVASGLQRIGRAGHQVGEISAGVIFPSHRADLLHSTVASERMLAGRIEAIAIPQNPLDILAQQTVAALALDALQADEWYEIVRRSAPFATLPRSAFDATLDLLSGLYPSDEFAELRPRIVYDRVSGELTGRPGAQRLAVTSGGTIPDRGLFGVFMVGSSPTGSGGAGSRVGELDEEMVYESRVGDVFALGTTSWRIEDITHDRVLVSPAFGVPARAPFWKGDGIGRPVELGAAIGEFAREVSTHIPARGGETVVPDALRERLAIAGLDDRAQANLAAFLVEQKASTGAVPTDQTLVVERFHDELGDWRVILHSPFGMQVHAPWALAVGARIRERLGVDGAAMASDDGVVVRVPDTDGEPPGAELFVFEADELRDLVTEEVGGSALFASRFRENAARALLLPRYNPGKRSPLWQQRQRAAQLLDVARKYPSFPIVLETVREVLQDVYDVPALLDLVTRIGGRSIRIVEAETDIPSPYARSMLFGYVAAFMYEGDSPLAERRAAALSLDPTLLAELLGRAELRELLDPAVLEKTERELQRLDPERQVRADVEGAADLVRILGPLTLDEITDRMQPGADAAALAADLVAAGRAFRVSIGGSERLAAIEDAARLRDALGSPIPVGVPLAFLEPVPDPLGDLVARFARTHGPFEVADVATRFGLGPAVVLDSLRRLGADRRVVDGEFRPSASGTEWCDAEVLRRLRSRSLAALRKEVEPVDHGTFARFLGGWQHVGTGTSRPGLAGVDGVAQVIDQLAGVPLPASAWESLILPARVRDYTPAWLDELTLSGEVIWSGDGSLPGSDGWVSLHLADSASTTLSPGGETELDELEQSVLEALAGGGAFFFRQLATAVGIDVTGMSSGLGASDKTLTTALWNLVWAGLVTNDTFAPLRSYLGGPAATPRARTFRKRARPASATQAGPPLVAGRWSLVPTGSGEPTIRAKATAEQLLERHGVVTRGAVAAEGVPGGFATVYRVLSGFEESGRARRGYFVEGLGAAQFATGATIDRLRSFALPDDAEPPLAAVTLAATDPANPYGAALPWPSKGGAHADPVESNAPVDAPLDAATAAEKAAGKPAEKKHRAARKAGAMVVLVDGALAIYLEKGGKSALTFTDDASVLAAASASLVGVVRRSLGKSRIDRVDGEFIVGTPLGVALVEAGFGIFPQGLRLRA